MTRWLYKLPLRFRSLFRKGCVEQELAEELRFHLEKLIEDNIGRGKTPEEARCAALCELGGLEQIKEECRDTRRVNYIESLFQDIRYGLRMLAKSPGFTAVAVLTLALGIGANTAIFSVVNAVMLRPLPYRDPDRLVFVWETRPPEWGVNPLWFSVAPTTFLDWREQNRVFEDMAAVKGLSATLTGKGEPSKIECNRVSASFFPLLGIRPLIGRTFLPEEDQPGRDGVVVVSYAVWQRYLGGDSELNGHRLTLDAKQYTVIGAMPPGFRFLSGFRDSREPEVWLTNPVDGIPLPVPIHTCQVLARLKPGVSLAQAQAQMKTIRRRLEQVDENSKLLGVDVVPMGTHLVQDVRLSLFVLVGAALFVVLIACANMANLLLARGATRQTELAIRVAVGARRWRLIRQLLTESVLLAFLGGTLGLRLAAAVRNAVWAVDKDQPIESITTMKQFVSDTLKERRFYLLLLGIFGAVALTLATVGIYGVISYSVARRTHEIGIRMALGATRRDVLKLVVGRGMALLLIGVMIGIAGAIGLTRFLISLLYEVRPADPLTFAGVSLLLATCIIQASVW